MRASGAKRRSARGRAARRAKSRHQSPANAASTATSVPTCSATSKARLCMGQPSSQGTTMRWPGAADRAGTRPAPAGRPARWRAPCVIARAGLTTRRAPASVPVLRSASQDASDMGFFASVNGVVTEAAEARVSVLDNGFTFGDARVRDAAHLRRPPVPSRPPPGPAAPLGRGLRIALPLATTASCRSASTRCWQRSQQPRVLPAHHRQPRRRRHLVPLRARAGTDGRDGRRSPTSRSRRGLLRDGIAGHRLLRAPQPSRARSTPRIKCCNLLNNVLAMQEAQDKGALEPIMLNAARRRGRRRQLERVPGEGRARWSRPPLDAGILAGVTRELVLERAAARWASRCARRTVRVPELLAADEVFITSSLKELVPMRTIDGRAGRRWPPRPGDAAAAWRTSGRTRRRTAADISCYCHGSWLLPWRTIRHHPGRKIRTPASIMRSMATVLGVPKKAVAATQRRHQSPATCSVRPSSVAAARGRAPPGRFLRALVRTLTVASIPCGRTSGHVVLRDAAPPSGGRADTASDGACAGRSRTSARHGRRRERLPRADRRVAGEVAASRSRGAATAHSASSRSSRSCRIALSASPGSPPGSTAAARAGGRSSPPNSSRSKPRSRSVSWCALDQRTQPRRQRQHDGRQQELRLHATPRAAAACMASNRIRSCAVCWSNRTRSSPSVATM